MRKLVLRVSLPVLMAALLLAGCLKPLVTASTLGSGAPDRSPSFASAIAPLQGQVEHHSYQVQGSTIADIAVGSTVSLIDTTTNQTISTTVTDSNGNFTLKPSGSFAPKSTDIYYLEAYKGLPAGGAPNRAGISMARVRTLIRYENAIWRHLYTGEGIRISLSSTALSVLTSLRSASASTQVDPATLLGSLTPGLSGDTFVPGTSGVTNAEFQTVRGYVAQCLNGDQDPLYRITYDVTSRAYFLVEKGVEISSVQPVSGPMGTPVTIQGSNLGTTPIVRFNGAEATCSVNGVSSIITTTVPRGATSGPLTVQIGSIVFIGANFAVSPWDGHNVFDAAGNMYVASSRDNRIYRFDPSGKLSLYSKDALLSYPKGLVVDPQGNVYVANWNANNILKIDTGKNVSIYATGGGINGPQGLAMDGAGDLYIANYNGNNILKVASGSATPTTFATSPDFKNPFGLAFDSQGTLYASNWNGGTVFKITPDGTVGPFASGFALPGGLAFDSSDNLYIACYNTQNVFKVTPQGGYSVFTSISHFPSWTAMNPDGTLYVGSFNYNFIAKVDSQARIIGYLSSGHLTWSLKANPANNDLYVASGNGWGSYTKTIYRMAYNPAATDYDGYEPPTPVIQGLPNPSAIDYVDATTMYVGDWGGMIFKANPSNGSYVPYAGNLGSISDLLHDGAGNLYAAGWGSHVVYQFSGGSLVKRFGNAWYLSNAAFGPDGYLYIPEDWKGKILRVSPTGVVSTYSDNGGAGFAGPRGVTFDPSGNLYVSSWGNDRIYRIATGSLAVTTYATGMSDPNGLSFDPAGNLFVSNSYDSTVKKIAPGATPEVGGAVTNFATGLNNPRGLALNPADGTLYVPAWNGSVYKITSAGAVSTHATGLGNCMQAFLDTNGNLLVASYSNRAIYVLAPGGGAPIDSYSLPVTLGGVVKDGSGALYAISWDAANVYRFDSGSKKYRLWANSVQTPAGMVQSPDQTSLYVTDWSNKVVNRIDLNTGAISIAANSVDWLGSGGELKGITYGSDGMLYVSTWGTGVYKLDPGQINPNNGTGVVRYGNNDPSNGIRGGIAFGAGGNLYGTTWDWTNNGSAPITCLPAGGGNGTSLKNFPNRIGF